VARQNRRDIFDPNEVGAFHAVQRTVRRAWLCGHDPVSGKSFEHRRTWIQNRLQDLAASFGIDCLSFAVMVNHVHVILRNRPDVVAGWSDEEVARRWWQLFPLRKNKDKSPAVPTESELKLFMSPARSKQLRTRLSDISWWMRALAEPIARRSNLEDKCSGRFWEGRYKCQKLADETAILACSAYVDLNPVRAGVADAPEKSRYTSVYERVEADKAVRKERAKAKLVKRRIGRSRAGVSNANQSAYVRRDDWLTPLTIDERSVAYKGPMPSKTGKRASDKGFLGMSFELYLKLLDWTGRQIRRDHKKGHIPSDLAPIMERIGLSGELWCDVVKRFGKIFKRVAGTPESLAQEAVLRGQSHYRTQRSPIPSAG
jgi:REP element-mobilizing transposase RayT